jgi:hypothetical protein
MPKRLVMTILAFCLITPSLAFADSSSALDPNSVPASSLGPQSVGGSAGGSNADSSALQPAGQSPLQSTTADSAGLGAPSSALQAPASSSDSLRVLSGEADGTPHQTDAPTATPWVWLAVTFVLALIVAGIVLIIRDRRRFTQFEV